MTDPNILDQSQRELALDPSQSFIVQAPAGSGKTELLTQRFLHLLLRVEKNPEQILAITFTNKAAAEMRARIMGKLKLATEKAPPKNSYQWATWELAKKVLNRSHAEQWDLLNNPNRLKIMTIDAFCAQLTQQLPILSQFGVQPTVNPEPQALYEAAIDELLQHLEDDLPWTNSIATLLGHLDNDYLRLKRLLLKLLESREQWLPHITGSDTQTTQAHLNLALHHIVEQQLIQLEQAMMTMDQETLLQIILFVGSNITEASELFPLKSLQTTLPDFAVDQLPFWQAMAKLFLTAKFQWRKRLDKKLGFPAPSSAGSEGEKVLFKCFKEQMQQLIEEQNDDLQMALSEVIECPAPAYSPEQWTIIQALVEILPILAAQLTVVFRDKGQVDFSQIATQARVALGAEEAPTDLSLALDDALHHILIDEFQDTSQSQFRLLELLTCTWQNNDGRTLFLVGDPMQSIYRFRQAEVGLFLKAQAHGIAEIKLTPITLSTNFRSDHTIVEWINTTFANLFPNANDLHKGAITYSPSHAFHNDDATSQVVLQGLCSEQGNNVASAHYVTQIIQQCRHDDPNHSIAILVKSRSHLREILPLLQDLQIPYQAVEIEPLCHRPAIQDLWHLTRALLYLADRSAWLTVLRAPWCGLTLSDLTTIAQHPQQTLWQRVNNPQVTDLLSTDGKQRLQGILPALQQAMTDRGRLALRDWVENLWYALEGPGYLHTQSDLDDVQQYFSLLEAQQQSQDLLELARFEKKLQTLYASPANSSHAVQVMTIHKSKGLEFDTVILPALEKQPAIDQAPLLAWMEQPQASGPSDLLLAPIPESMQAPDPIYAYIRKQNSQKAFHEAKRLLYVATTRAKKRLYLIANLKNTDEGILPPNKNSFLGHLWSHHEGNFIQQHAVDVEENLEQTLPRLKRRKHPNVAAQGALWNNAVIDNQQYTLLTDHTPQAIGTVAHHLIHQITLHGIAHWQDQSKEQRRRYIHTQLTLQGLHQAMVPEATETVIVTIETMIGDSKGQWLLRKHDHGEAEYPMTCQTHKGIKHYIIDRTFVCEEGIRWIIDYKTALPSCGEQMDIFIKNQQDNYNDQLEQYALCFPTAKKIRLALYFPLCQGWVEWAHTPDAPASSPDAPASSPDLIGGSRG